MNLLQSLGTILLEAGSAKFITIAVCAFAMVANAIGEALIVIKSVDGMSRNPEAASKLQTAMTLGCALVETTAIYSLLIAILVLFVAN
ncbi:MAG: ATP synthase F0 subunit C [Bacilli bacterium]|jgi:F-type H+-transporting ATPase subunit c|nr:ATP synthase F0 subunit C [Bacilli bacterium]